MTNPLPQGTHTWAVEAFDLAGNTHAGMRGIFTIDSQSPNPFSLRLPADSTVLGIPTPTFSWTSTSDDLSGLSHYQLWINGQVSVDSLKTTSSAPSQVLDEGAHQWHVKAVDRAGNSRTSSEMWTVFWDPTPPETFDSISPADGDTVMTKRPVFLWSASNDVGSGLKRYELWINEVKNKNVSPSDTSTTPDSDLENGNYNWFI